MSLATSHQQRRTQTQAWEIGAVVRVGFLTLRVYGKDTGCGTWRLESMGGAKHYRFAPYHGIVRIN